MENDFILANDGECYFEEKKSRFFGYAFAAANKNDVEEHLNNLRRDFADATHIVFAYRIGKKGALEYFTDAGEPTGTAGAPMIRVLQGRKLTDTFVAAIRYYGGIKLGTGGLARAYGNCARLAVENAGIVERVVFEKARIILPYNLLTQIAITLDAEEATVLDQVFSTNVELIFRAPQHKIPEIEKNIGELSRGAVKIEHIE